jgi:hypothetical protein
MRLIIRNACCRIILYFQLFTFFKFMIVIDIYLHPSAFLLGIFLYYSPLESQVFKAVCFLKTFQSKYIINVSPLRYFHVGPAL